MGLLGFALSSSFCSYDLELTRSVLSLPLPMLQREMWPAVVLRWAFWLQKDAEIAAGNRRSLQNLTPISAWLSATEINSSRQWCVESLGRS